MIAAEKGYKDIVRHLVENKADTDIQNKVALNTSLAIQLIILINI